MKTNRRILSVILTLALALSLFVFAPMGAHAGEGSTVIAGGETAGDEEGLGDSDATQGGQSASGQDGNNSDGDAVLDEGNPALVDENEGNGAGANEEEGLGDSEAIQGQPNPPGQDSGDLAALGDGELTPLGEGGLSPLAEKVCEIVQAGTSFETLDDALTAVASGQTFAGKRRVRDPDDS